MFLQLLYRTTYLTFNGRNVFYLFPNPNKSVIEALVSEVKLIENPFG